MVCAGLVAAVAILYARVAGHDFITFDDPGYVSENPHVRGGWSWDGLAWAWTSFDMFNWHPLTWMSHQLDCELWGLDAGAHLLTNVALHAVSVVLLLLFLHRATGRLWTSALVAGLFALHPLRVESVAWVSERKDVLSAALWMLTLVAYGGYARRPSVGRYLAVVLAFALGLTAKPMLVTLPFVLLLLDVWPLRRWRGACPVPGPSASARRLLVEKLPLLALSAGACILTYLAQSTGAVSSWDEVPLGARIGNAAAAYLTYVVKAFWPTDLACFYPHSAFMGGDGLPVAAWIGGALTVAATSAAVVGLLVGRALPLAVGWLWFVGTLVPVIGLVQVGAQAWADRYSSIPSIGLAMAVAWGWSAVARRWSGLRSAVPAVALLALAAATWQQVPRWRDSETLYEHALAVTTDNYVMHNNLAAVLLGRGDIDGAHRHLEEAIRIKPDYGMALNNLGHAFYLQGDRARAAEQYERSLALRADDAEALNHMGVLMLDGGDLAAAVGYFELAVTARPDHVMAHFNLAGAHLAQGSFDRAEHHYGEAVRHRPDYAEALNNLGMLAARRGELEQAVAHFERAVEAKPSYDQARANLEHHRALLERAGTGGSHER